MSKESFVLLIGIIVFFGPFLGLPTEYKDILFAVAGLLLIVTGYRLRRRAYLASLEREGGERVADAFVESGSTLEPREAFDPS
ncbi:MAG TPA: hypothetical protein VFS75_01065 [Candidatus Paceibacterota bacterium]|nr:hypothetical protein [Candidatus Paceibacterota bacterium]